MIYDLYYDNIYKFAYFKVGKQEEAEDIAQNTFIGALKNICKFDARKADSDFSAWLFTIARNHVINFYRRNGNNKPGGQVEDLQIPDKSQNVQDLIDANGDVEMIYTALKDIPESQQQVLIHRFINEYSIKETALTMRKSEGAIKTLQVRALESLRKIVERNNNGSNNGQ